MMSLVEKDGVLYLCEGQRPRGGVLRRSSRSFGFKGEVIQTKQLERLQENQVGSVLAKLDDKLTKPRGLRQLNGERKWVSFDQDLSNKPILLFIHGTFSNNDNLLRELVANERGNDFLTWASNRYEVLAFDHPTLSVSPMVNAHELERLLRGIPDRQIDVVCHSRGGLVSRWWLEAFDTGDPKLRRVAFVGSPLKGTGLAAPPRIRASLSLLTNISDVLGKVAGTGAAAFPFLAVASTIFQIVRSVTSFASKTPAIDAAIAMVPGLNAMSAVGNNYELLSLRREEPVIANRYFVVKSNFEPEDPKWKFWKHFRPSHLKDKAADLVFEGENDLVVDTDSMANLADANGFTIPEKQTWDFGTSETVHHTNYFRQKETLEFLQTRAFK
jgi:pimeloyl-ACP methyl ester carboxylesterase